MCDDAVVFLDGSFFPRLEKLFAFLDHRQPPNANWASEAPFLVAFKPVSHPSADAPAHIVSPNHCDLACAPSVKVR
jgi:hypothetical protein